MLTKPVLYLFVIPNFFFSLYLTLKKKNIKIILTSLLSIAFVIGYCGWNYQRTGYFHYSSIQNSNLLNYNLYYFLINKKGEDFANKTIEEIDKKVENMSYREKNKYIKEIAIKILLKEHLPSYSIFHLKGIFCFFLDPGRFDLQSFFGFKKARGKGLFYQYSKFGLRGVFSYLKEQSIFLILLLIPILFFNLLKFLSLFFFFFNKKIDLEIKIFFLLLIGYLSFLSAPLGASRYALPILPILIFAFLNSSIILYLPKANYSINSHNK
ncbi:MAG: hypothetical protein ABIN61_07515 [candidate division WOR-3 bacterium]